MLIKLNQAKIDYILYHLDMHINLKDIKKYFVYGEKPEPLVSPYIFFPLSDKELSKNFKINNIPVLYPILSNLEFYHFDTQKNLIFNHDLIKSAFYLLSGFQETQPYQGDHFGRYTYHESIQKELGIADFPIVNEYFSIIIDAFQKFCSLHNIKIEKRNKWGKRDFALYLTHDVDRVDKWTYLELKKRLKIVIQSYFIKNWSYLLESLINYPTNRNPYWNFEWMKNLENKYNFNSTWFFLPKGHPVIDSYYSFSERRIKDLARFLTESGDTIGLHGTFISRLNSEIMKSNLKEVETLTTEKVIASRQHWLSFKFPDTLQILESTGIKYDSSWGFAEHYGWRNSYCLPFFPYDFDKDRMMNILEIPLNAMDVTFFQYMGLDLDKTFDAFKTMIKTCKKYNGLFVFLWHNSHFDETRYPGITELYKNILQYLNQQNPKVVSGRKSENFL
jgi:hypothetical protein